jgi:uncharacterized integral membrane protein
MKAKIIIFMILIVLFTIFVSQNTTVIKLNAFFWTFEMSAIVLISLTGLFGVILGFILASMFNKPKKIEKSGKQKEEEKKKEIFQPDKNIKPGI